MASRLLCGSTPRDHPPFPPSAGRAFCLGLFLGEFSREPAESGLLALLRHGRFVQKWWTRPTWNVGVLDPGPCLSETGSVWASLASLASFSERRRDARRGLGKVKLETLQGLGKA